jgi:hypothetical protein
MACSFKSKTNIGTGDNVGSARAEFFGDVERELAFLDESTVVGRRRHVENGIDDRGFKRIMRSSD